MCACASSRSLTVQENFAEIEHAYERFDSQETTAPIALSFRSDQLRGKVKGVLSRAAENVYRIELFARNDLFLKAYLTRTMTVVWPEGASPLVLSDDQDILLSEIASGLPEWPLRSCLPFVMISPDSEADSLIRLDDAQGDDVTLSKGRAQTLVVAFSRRASSVSFPYSRIAIEEPGTQNRLIWKIKP